MKKGLKCRAKMFGPPFPNGLKSLKAFKLELWSEWCFRKSNLVS